jgi:hypothetical protein
MKTNTDPILNYFSALHILAYCFSKICFNINLASISRSSNTPLLYNFCHFATYMCTVCNESQALVIFHFSQWKWHKHTASFIILIIYNLVFIFMWLFSAFHQLQFFMPHLLNTDTNMCT